MSTLVMMSHALLGVLFILTSVWVLVESANATPGNQKRIQWASRAAAVLMWLTYIIGGYWYVTHYGADKAVILKGPWPFAHSFFMEAKEHILLSIVLLATYLPIVTSTDLSQNKSARNLTMCVASLMVILGLAMDGAGAIISLGAKVALQVSQAAM
ncbi:hypothetical protein [uncultured Pseudodesulfovibrio sp.]|uniref:hypothetical protein n=1 Tax=uncultured Pseudodesulfovibrio sp. TaxID=2035858 RepID=UPI0029C98A95|nr:hypothetical protein [uncultured Pseudodesulfovibrio sp.]